MTKGRVAPTADGRPRGSKSQFRQLKEITQKFSPEAKAYRKIAPSLKEFGLGELPDNPADIEKTLEQFSTKLHDRPAIDPAVSEELETYRILTRNSEVQRSLSFDRDFVKSVNNAFGHSYRPCVCDTRRSHWNATVG